MTTGPRRDTANTASAANGSTTPDKALALLDQTITSTRGRAALGVIRDELAQIGNQERAKTTSADFGRARNRREQAAALTKAQRAQRAAQVKERARRAFGAR